MDNVFLITSAIGKDYGVFTLEERFNQLLETISSINKYCPNSDIFLFDASKNELDREKLEKLKSLCSLHFVRSDPLINQANNVKERYVNSDEPWNYTENKTVSEIRIMQLFFYHIKKQGKKYNRVFKITGRYKLNDDFNLSDHILNKNKVVFISDKERSTVDSMATRFWSFDYNMLDIMIQMMENVCITTIEELNRNNTFSIIEVSFFKEILKLNIPYAYIKVLGIEGRFGLTGFKLKE